MAKFDIYGMCILRDVFEFIPDNKHEVQHFLQWSSPVTNFIYNKKPSRVMELRHFGHDREKENFMERCVMRDYNRTVLDYYEPKADYFMLDLVMLVHTSLCKEMLPDGEENIFTYSSAFIKLIDNGLRNNFFENSSFSFMYPLEVLENLGYEKVVDEFVKWLIEDKGYREDQIILVESEMVYHYTDGNSLFELGYDYNRENEKLRECYRYFKESCPGCHSIKMPYNVYSDLNHRWGVSDLHYSIDYYKYLYLCIDAIVKKEKVINELNILHDKYSRYFSTRILELMKNSFQYTNGRNLIYDSFCENEIEGYIAPKGTAYFENLLGERDSVGVLNETVEVKPYGTDAMFTRNDIYYYIPMDSCVKGYCGKGKLFCKKWKTFNSTTEVQLTGNSAIVSHNGIDEKWQCNIIQIVDNNEALQGMPIVFSVYARVIKLNDDGNGGTIALINDNGYNKGKFIISKSFNNTSWKRIYVTKHMPTGEEFKGLTVCLRAISSSKKGNGAIVEFRDPKLEIGAFPTAIK